MQESQAKWVAKRGLNRGMKNDMIIVFSVRVVREGDGEFSQEWSRGGR